MQMNEGLFVFKKLLKNLLFQSLVQSYFLSNIVWRVECGLPLLSGIRVAAPAPLWFWRGED